MPCRLALVLTTRRRTVTDVFSAFCHYFTFCNNDFLLVAKFPRQGTWNKYEMSSFPVLHVVLFVGIVECTFVVAFPKNFGHLIEEHENICVSCRGFAVGGCASQKPLMQVSSLTTAIALSFPKSERNGGDGVCSVVERIMQLRRLSEVFNELGRKKCASKLGKY